MKAAFVVNTSVFRGVGSACLSALKTRVTNAASSAYKIIHSLIRVNPLINRGWLLHPCSSASYRGRGSVSRLCALSFAGRSAGCIIFLPFPLILLLFPMKKKQKIPAPIAPTSANQRLAKLRIGVNCEKSSIGVYGPLIRNASQGRTEQYQKFFGSMTITWECITKIVISVFPQHMLLPSHYCLLPWGRRDEGQSAVILSFPRHPRAVSESVWIPDPFFPSHSPLFRIIL